MNYQKRSAYSISTNILLAMLVTLINSTAFASTFDSSHTTAGRIVIASGNVYALSKTSEKRPLNRRSKVFEGDTIHTGENSAVQIRFKDGAIVALRDQSQFKVETYRANKKPDDKVSLELLKGGFRTITGRVGKDNKEAYEVKTPVASIGIRGTNFEVVLEPDNTIVAGVWSGGIEIKNDKGSLPLGLGAEFNFARTRQNSSPRGLLEPPTSLGKPLSAGVSRDRSNREEDSETEENSDETQENDEPETEQQQTEDGNEPDTQAQTQETGNEDSTDTNKAESSQDSDERQEGQVATDTGSKPTTTQKENTPNQKQTRKATAKNSKMSALLDLPTTNSETKESDDSPPPALNVDQQTKQPSNTPETAIGESTATALNPQTTEIGGLSSPTQTLDTGISTTDIRERNISEDINCLQDITNCDSDELAKKLVETALRDSDLPCDITNPDCLKAIIAAIDEQANEKPSVGNDNASDDQTAFDVDKINEDVDDSFTEPTPTETQDDGNDTETDPVVTETPTTQDPPTENSPTNDPAPTVDDSILITENQDVLIPIPTSSALTQTGFINSQICELTDTCPANPATEIDCRNNICNRVIEFDCSLYDCNSVAELSCSANSSCGNTGIELYDCKGASCGSYDTLDCEATGSCYGFRILDCNGTDCSDILGTTPCTGDDWFLRDAKTTLELAEGRAAPTQNGGATLALHENQLTTDSGVANNLIIAPHPDDTLEDVTENVNGLGITWGRWNTTPGSNTPVLLRYTDRNSVIVPVDDTLLFAIATRADVSSLIGQRTYSANADSTKLLMTHDNLDREIESSFNIDFGSGKITDGRMRIGTDSDPLFKLRFSGYIQNNFAYLTIDPSSTDEVAGRSRPGGVYGDLSGVFVGNNGESFLKSFNLFNDNKLLSANGFVILDQSRYIYDNLDSLLAHPTETASKTAFGTLEGGELIQNFCTSAPCTFAETQLILELFKGETADIGTSTPTLTNTSMFYPNNFSNISNTQFTVSAHPNDTPTDFEQNVGGFDLDWGRWNATPDASTPLLVRRHVNFTGTNEQDVIMELDQEFIFATVTTTDVTQVTGMFDYNSSAALFSTSDGISRGISSSFRVNFDTDTVSNGNLRIGDANNPWINLSYDGFITSDRANFTIRPDASTDVINGAAYNGTINGQLQGVFTGTDGAGFVQQFNINESNAGANGVILLERGDPL